MEINIIIYWAVLTIVLRIIAGAAYTFQNDHWTWDFYKNNFFFGIVYKLISWAGVWALCGYILYLFYQLSYWWFS